MFSKLCKYEFRSLVRTLGPVYLAVIAVTIINTFIGLGSITGGNLNQALRGNSVFSGLINILQGVSAFVYFGVMVALAVLTLIIIIQRFYKGLLSDEGYLMFTLPVKPWQLIAAKGSVAFVMSVASMLVALLSILILVCGEVGPATFFSELARGWTALMAELSRWLPLWPLYVVEFLLLAIVSGLASLYQIYFAMALGHLSGKHRIMMSVVAYVAVSTILNIIFGFSMVFLSNFPPIQRFFDQLNSLPFMEWGNLFIQLIFLLSLLVGLAQLALFFFGTERILAKRLNLE